MERSPKALRLVTVDMEALLSTLGDEAGRSSSSFLHALSSRGYVPVPIPWRPGPVSRDGEIDLLILGAGETPVALPGDALLRAIAFMENAFHVGRAIGEPGEIQKERIVDIADRLERLAPDERSVLGAHYHHLMRTLDVPPRPLGLKAQNEAARMRLIGSLYAAVTADGTLYDVIVERLESVLDAEGLDGRRVMTAFVAPGQVVLRFARAEHDPSRWSGLDENDARMLSWIVARPRAKFADLDLRARQIGVDAHGSMMRIRQWIESGPALGGLRQIALPQPENHRP